MSIALWFTISGAAFAVTLNLHAHPPAFAPLVVSAWLVALSTFLLGCWASDRRWPSYRPLELGWTRADTLLVSAAVAIALLLRVIGLAVAPRTMNGDEATLVMEGVRVLEGQITDPFATSWLSHPTLWFYLQAASLLLFGDTLAGARILAAVIGTLTVASTYVFARLLFTPRIAAVTALLLATYHFHIHYSRMAMNNIADAWCGTVTLSIFVLALRTRRRLLFGMCGLSLGLALYFYHGARLFIVLLPMLAGLRLLQSGRWWRQRETLARWVVEAGLTAAGALLAAGPLLQFFARNPAEFSARVAMEGITPRWLAQEALNRRQSELAVLWDQFQLAALAFTAYADRSLFYDSERPLLWGVAAGLLLLGLLVSLARIRAWSYQLVVLWFCLTIVIGGMLFFSPPRSPRYVGLAPVVCLFIAVAVDWNVQHIKLLLPRPAWVSQLFAGLLVLYLALGSANGYFREYLPRESIGGISTGAANALAHYLVEQPQGTRVWFLGAPRMYYDGFSLLDFLVRDVEASDVVDPIRNAAEVPDAAAAHPTIYALIPEREAELALIRQRYPDGELLRLTWLPYQDPVMLVYRLP